MGKEVISFLLFQSMSVSKNEYHIYLHVLSVCLLSASSIHHTPLALVCWSGTCVQEGQCCTSSLVSAMFTQSCGDGCCLEESGRSALVHFSLVLSCPPVLPHRPQSRFLLGHSSRPPQYHCLARIWWPYAEWVRPRRCADTAAQTAAH